MSIKKNGGRLNPFLLKRGMRGLLPQFDYNMKNKKRQISLF
jgi:hypothetical protein